MNQPLPNSVRVDSHFAEKPSRPRPRWWERLRGLLGMGFMVVLMAMLLATLVAVTILTIAVLVATSFS